MAIATTAPVRREGMGLAGPNPTRAALRLRALSPVAFASLVLLLIVSSPATALGPTEEAWPQFRGSDSRVGVAASEIPSTNETLWELRLPDQVQSSFSVVGGRALVGCDDGTLYCLDADSGDLLWRFNTTNVVQSTPLVSEDLVYFGSSDGHGYCLRLEDGSKVWEVECNSIVASPALWNGTVYFADQWGTLCAVDALTGAERWNDTFPLDLWASPTVVDGRLYIGDISGQFRCYDAATGRELWNRSWGVAEVYSSACVVGGRVLVGTGLLDTLECLDALTGETVWTFDAGHEVYSSVAVSRGVVFVHSWEVLWAIPLEDPDGDGRIAEGEVLWSFHTRDSEGGSSPAVSGDRLVVGTSQGALHCVNSTTGEAIWATPIPGFVVGSPAVAMGRVYVGSTAGHIVCVGPPFVPRLYTTLLPSASACTGGQSIDLDVRVLTASGEVGGDPFMHYEASDGTLFATFGTVVEGQFKNYWTAPEISSTVYVTITATGELPGFEVVPAQVTITVEPAEEAPAPEVPRVSHPYLLAGVLAFVIVDVALMVVIVRGREEMGGLRV